MIGNYIDPWNPENQRGKSHWSTITWLYISKLPCLWVWQKLQLSKEAQVADSNPAYSEILPKAVIVEHQGYRRALAFLYWSILCWKEKTSVIVHTNDLYILIRNAWVKITSWNLLNKRFTSCSSAFGLYERSNKLISIRSEKISRKLIRNWWFHQGWKYQIFQLTISQNIRLTKRIDCRI